MNVTVQIPTEIQSLIAEGFWPADKTSAQKQNLKSLLSPESVQRFAPEESQIFLYPPPFATVRMEMEKNSFWSDPRSALSEIDPDRSVVIGDFGLGSDAAILLDYRKGRQNPSVLRLRWSTDGNHWVQVAPDLATFVAFLKG